MEKFRKSDRSPAEVSVLFLQNRYNGNGEFHMKGTEEIRTERLLLRRHKESDAGILYELAGKNEEMYR